MTAKQRAKSNRARGREYEQILSPASVLQGVYEALGELKQVVKVASDTLECRVERAFQDVATTALLPLPEDEPVPIHSFQSEAESAVRAAGQELAG